MFSDPFAPIPNPKGNHVSGGVKYTGVGKWRFSTEIAVYLGNGTRYAHALIGSHRWLIDTCQF